MDRRFIPGNTGPRYKTRAHPKLFHLQVGDEHYIKGKTQRQVTCAIAYVVKEGIKTEGVRKRFTTKKVRGRGTSKGVRVTRIQ